MDQPSFFSSFCFFTRSMTFCNAFRICSACCSVSWPTPSIFTALSSRSLAPSKSLYGGRPRSAWSEVLPDARAAGAGRLALGPPPGPPGPPVVGDLHAAGVDGRRRSRAGRCSRVPTPWASCWPLTSPSATVVPVGATPPRAWSAASAYVCPPKARVKLDGPAIGRT